MQYIGKKVFILFKDGERGVYGQLGYVNDFSVKYDFRKPDYFYINHTSFKATHVRKVLEDGNITDYPEVKHQFDNLTGSMNLH